MVTTLSHIGDAELFSRLRGEKAEADAAFQELYSRYSPRIYDYCHCVTGSTDEANDIFQDVFIKFYHSARQERLMSNVPGFLIRIARNLCIDYQRSKKKTVELHPDWPGESLVQSYEQKELLDILSTALSCLEFEYRDAFVLRMYQGLDYDEISAITGDSANAVRNRVWRAKEKVRTILSPYLEELSKL